MPKTKAAGGKAKKTSRTPKRTSPATKYECPNPGAPLGLRAIVQKMEAEPAFAAFIRRLLCEAHRGDEDARACLETYYNPTKSELSALCIPQSSWSQLSGCTDVTTLMLIDVPAIVFSGGRW